MLITAALLRLMPDGGLLGQVKWRNTASEATKMTWETTDYLRSKCWSQVLCSQACLGARTCPECATQIAGRLQVSKAS